MATLSQAKVLGGVGAILVFIPFVSLVGYILIIVAVRDISNYLQDRSIFRNIVISAAAGIVGALAGALVVVVGVLGAGITFGISGVAGVGAGLLIAWISLIVSAVFLRRAYGTIAARLGVGTFRTAATLYLVGAALTIVLIGFILLFIAEIMLAVAYFSMPDQLPTQGTGGSSSPAIPPPSMRPQGDAAKFCTSCGTKISPSATFCYHCGAKQP